MRSRISTTLLAAICSLLCSLPYAGAQDRPIDLIPDDAKAELNKSLANVVNALHVFSSSDNVSSGYYDIDEDAQPNSDLEVLKLANDYYFADKDSSSIAPFASAMFGHVNFSGQVPPTEVIGQNDFFKFETTSIGLGGGANVTVFDRLHLVPKMMFIYSHTSNGYDYNNLESQTFLAPFDRDLFNWDVDTMTYIPSVELYHDFIIGQVKIQPSVQYSHIEVHSVWTNSALLDVDTSTDILRTKLMVSSPLGVELACMPLEIETFGARHDIYGDARDATGFQTYHEIGAALYANVEETLPLFKRLGLASSYAWNSDFNGWRVGFQGEIS